MSPQVERLKRDSKELKHYVYKLQKQGDETTAFKMKSKIEYINSKIDELTIQEI